MKKIFLCLTLSLLNGFSSYVYSQQTELTQNSTDNGYVTDLNLALRLSKETKQNTVLIFSANWCGHCKNLKQDLHSIKEFDNKLICILDSDKEKRLSRQFKARSLPTSIMLNSNGEEISRMTGYEKESYIKWLNNR